MIEEPTDVPKPIEEDFLSGYLDFCQEIKSPNFDPKAIHPDLSHAIFGIVTEAAELLDAIQKTPDVFYADKVNMKEEIGDVCWYLSIAEHHYKEQGIESHIFSKENPYQVQYKGVETFIQQLNVAAGELLDVIKRSYYYGKAEDTPEIKDLPCLFNKVFRLCCAIVQFLHIQIEEALEANMKKLRKRFPKKFDTEKVFNRDLDAERKILEQRS